MCLDQTLWLIFWERSSLGLLVNDYSHGIHIYTSFLKCKPFLCPIAMYYRYDYPSLEYTGLNSLCLSLKCNAQFPIVLVDSLIVGSLPGESCDTTAPEFRVMRGVSFTANDHKLGIMMSSFNQRRSKMDGTGAWHLSKCGYSSTY